MASAPESLFFPPLEKCFSGERLLISWKKAFKTLSDPSATSSGPALRRFFSDEQSISLLSRPFEPFPAPSPSTKADFETKTAAIHITPSDDGQYDIRQIKEDALWLSQQANIDEVSALRLVVHEWQERSALQLLDGYTESEALSLEQAVGSGSLLSAVLNAKPSVLAGEFKDDAARRERLLRMYLVEKEAVLSTSLALVAKRADGTAWQKDIGGRVVAAQLSSVAGKDSSPVSFALGGIDALRKRLADLERGSGWSDVAVNPADLEQEFQTRQLIGVVHILHLMFRHLDDVEQVTPSALVRKWFTFCQEFGFFENFRPPSPSQQVFVPPLQCLLALVSLVVLKLPDSVAYLLDSSDTDFEVGSSEPESEPYITNTTCLHQINEVFFAAVEHGAFTASLCTFAWTILLQTMRGVVAAQEADTQASGSPTLARHASDGDDALAGPKVKCLQDVLDNVMSLPLDEDPISYLARTVVGGLQVYSVTAELSIKMDQIYSSSLFESTATMARKKLLELMRESLPHTGYGPEVLAAILAILSGSPHSPSPRGDSAVIQSFLEDMEVLIPMVLQQAMTRYPYETAPMLKLCKALTTSTTVDKKGFSTILELLHSTPRFTQSLPDGFQGYDLVREEENVGGVSLTEDLPLFINRKARGNLSLQDSDMQLLSNIEMEQDENSWIPRATVGYVINDSRPFVVMWEHAHSSLKYLARLLSTSLVGSSQMDTAHFGAFESENAADIIDLFASTISATVGALREGRNAAECAEITQELVGAIGDGLDRGQDVVDLICSVFEQEIQRQPMQARGESSTDILVSCLKFFNAVIPVMPGRIWPLAAKCDLLEIDGKGGNLAAVVASTEMITGRYDFLSGCLSFFEGLVEDAIVHSAARKVPSAAVKRFEDASDMRSGLPEKLMGKVLMAFTRTFMDVSNQSLDWYFVAEGERVQLNTRIVDIFDRLVRTAYGFDDSQDLSHKITAVLSSSAKYVVDTFIYPSSTTTAPNRLLQVFASGSTFPDSTIFTRDIGYGRDLCNSTLGLLTTLMDVSILLETPFPDLQKQLLSSVPLLAHTCVVRQGVAGHIVSLLTTLLKSIGSAEKDSASVLGHLSMDSARQFLFILADISKALLNQKLETDVWNLFSAIVSNRQRWLATFLLTGETPKDLGRRKNCAPLKEFRREPVIGSALDIVSNITGMGTELDVAVVNFVSLAQSYWPWVTSKLDKHSKALKTILRFLEDLQDDPKINEVSVALAVANRNRIASTICDVLAMFVYTKRQIGDTSLVKSLVPKLGYLRARGVAIPSYNSSLHKNLENNLAKCFPGLNLSTFKRTTSKMSFGRDYCYDLGFASQVLGYHSAWASRSKGRGFAEEFSRANCNLSLVESQILLLKSWKSLLIELSSTSPVEEAVQKLLAAVAQNCLTANEHSENVEQIFEYLKEIRADLVLVLLQRLVNTKSSVRRMRELLPTAWRVVRTCGQDFEIAFVGDNTAYYRSLIRVLFLSLQPHAYLDAFETPSQQTNGSPSASHRPKPNDTQTASILVEISREVIGKGIRSLATNLHEDSENVLPSDFALLTALLQSILRIPDMNSVRSQIALQLSNSAVSRVAASLFSHADRLIAPGNDPIYGDLAIHFLLELSALPLMAEHLAVEGLLTDLAGAPLARYFKRRNGTGPFDEPSRLHAIWARGFLPLALNILDTVGAPMAAEVVAFLNTFPAQLARASNAFDTKSTVSSASKSPTAGCITLNVAIEIQSLALLFVMVEQYRNTTGAGDNIPPLDWDGSGVREDLEGWVQGSWAALRGRIVPTCERELALSRMAPDAVGDGAQNRLEQKVVGELTEAWRLLGGGRGSGVR